MYRVRMFPFSQKLPDCKDHPPKFTGSRMLNSLYQYTFDRAALVAVDSALPFDIYFALAAPIPTLASQRVRAANPPFALLIESPGRFSIDALLCVGECKECL